MKYDKLKIFLELTLVISAALTAGVFNVTAQSTSVQNYTFNVDLRLGSRSGDVLNLQKILNMSPDTMIASSGPGSPGNETSYFGRATWAAVKKYQLKYE